MVTIRKACNGDWGQMYRWIMQEEVRFGFTGEAISSWDEFCEYWGSRRMSWGNYVIQDDGEIVGHLWLVIGEDNIPEVGYLVGEIVRWGNGIGREGCRLGVEVLSEMGFSKVRAYIKDGNERSMRVVLGLGFKQVCERDGGQKVMEKALNGSRN